MIVTIDGPAGAGKSSAARSLAQRLGFRFLDTGAMYRAVTLEAMRRQIGWNDPETLAQLALGVDLRLTDDRVFLGGEDVTDAIRSFEVTTLTRHAADNLDVREQMVRLQRKMAAEADFVTEGRDQATVVFPDAQCKIYLTANDKVRAQRRFEDLVSRGERVSFVEVLEKQQQRDQQDRQRKTGGLRKAQDSIVVQTDGMTPEEVVHRLEEIVRSCAK